MRNKTIIKALKRVHDELEDINKKNLERMGILTHQIVYFDEMMECSQNMVLDDLFNQMKRLNEKYDAYYDDKKDEWLEDKCDNPNCEFCKDRPTKPSACKL